jgi:putative redox protein
MGHPKPVNIGGKPRSNMKTNTIWKSNMNFSGECNGNPVVMDAKPPLGKAEGMTPKELVAVGLSGCTAMDVIAFLKKHKQDIQEFNVEADVTKSTGGYPEVFTHILLTFNAEGMIEKEKLIEAVTLSQTKYCGVSAMLAKAFPIEYKIILNNEQIANGKASF